jgi:NAD+ synthase
MIGVCTLRQINLEINIENITGFIQQQLLKAGYEKIIVGLSGGIDSAVTAALSVKAVGNKNVIGVMLPYKKSHPDSLAHAKLLAEQLEISSRIIDISPIVDVYFNNNDSDADLLRKGNMMARVRMCILFDLSAKYRALVAGTGNKSELMIGYCTQYGDNACAFEPIGHLYKTEVKEIARVLQIPKVIIDKSPTADLWESQTDEAEMGISYVVLDNILFNLIELGKDKKEILDTGVTEGEIEKVLKMVSISDFKRKMPPVPKKK